MDSIKLADIYKRVLPTVRRILVYPHIEKSSRDNPYLSLLYKDCDITIESAKFANIFNAIFKYNTKTDLVHYHWLEITNFVEFFKTLYKLIPLLIFKYRGGKIVWTVHNILPHRAKWNNINLKLYRFWASKVDLLLVHSEDYRTIVADKYNINIDKIVSYPHPKYPTIPLRKEVHDKIGKALNINGPFVLMYGNIAKYKGIVEVAHLFNSSNFALKLVVAGAVKKGEDNYGMAVLSQSSDKVIVIDRRITDEEEAYLFNNCSYALFNFEEILTSGTVILAYSYHCKIITNHTHSELPKDYPIITYTTLEELIKIIENS